MKDPSDRTKVVVRRLPPSMSQPVLMEQIDGRFAGRYDWVCFRPGKNSQKNQRYTRAYLNFKIPDDVVEFAEFFDGHIFVNEKDPEYMEFLELISKPVEHLPSAEIQLERKEAERAGATKETPIVTPLMDFVRRKRAGGAQLCTAWCKLIIKASTSSQSPILVFKLKLGLKLKIVRVACGSRVKRFLCPVFSFASPKGSGEADLCGLTRNGAARLRQNQLSP
ncbi:Smg-4/UPF3 family [Musa troglodytarum]|uniref:Smg-4/UPF3 family n=1 Tax=Musa troglodytarum TaxID=320322 RepID=A0A9E7GHN4_9LILI|nr:Smg-4/UPF3 family [Musa troglodytarum]